MPISTGLRTLFLSRTDITSICKPQQIGNTTYPAVFNDNPIEGFKPPFVLITKMSVDPNVALDGTYGLRFTEFDIDSYSRSRVESEQLGDIVESFIKDYTGQAGPEDTIKAVIYEDRNSDSLYEDQGGDGRQYIESISVTIQHQPTFGS